MSDIGSFTSRNSASSGGDQDTAGINKPGKDDLDESASLLQGVFGVLYVVSKEQERVSWRFVAFRLLADVLQLFLLIVSPSYGWNIDADDPGWKAASFIGLNWFFASRGYSFFLACLYVMVVALCLVVALCVWVGWSFKNSRFDYVWPITVLRWYGKIFFQILDIASMSLFLIAMDCGYFGVANQYLNQEFPDQACFEMPHLIHLVVSVVSLILFVSMALTYQVADMELNPLSKNLIAMGHSMADVQGFMLRVFMTVANVFITDTRWLSIFYLGSSIVLVYLYYKWIPHLHAWVNHVRVASYAAITWASLLFVIVAFARGDGEDAVSRRDQATIALYAGIFPAACLGALASWLRTRYFMVTVLNRFKSAAPDTKPRLIYQFEDPREAEILVRCCRVWSPIDPELVEPPGVELAERIIKAGLELMPKAPYMVILHSSFLIDVQSSYQSGYTQLQSAKRMDPSFLERFAIFSREQQHTQQSSSTDGGNVNLVSYVEYQKNYRLVLKSHKEALIALRTFWQHLLHDNTKLLNLTRDVQRIDQSIRQAEAVYKMILTRHAANVKILRLYARFLEGVKHDPWSAAKWYSEADKLEQQEEDAKNGNMLTELGIDLHSAEAEGLKDLGALLNMKGGILGNHDTRAVFIVNAQCIIQVTNPTVQKIFGWSKTEIKGKNINVIVPPPFADMHTAFVRSHVLTGKENVIGHQNEFVAMHKDRMAIPVSLHVTKISGIGEDMLYMGIAEPLPVERGVAKAWVMVGSQAIVSVGPAFTDFFGFKSDELLGAQLEDWLVDTREVEKVLADVRGKDEPARSHRYLNKDHQSRIATKEIATTGTSTLQASMGSSSSKREEFHLKDLCVRHRYCDSLTVDATVSPGWIGSHRFLLFRLTQREPALTAISDKHGKLVHVTESLAAALNTTPKQLMQNGAPGALHAMMPQVFASLHDIHIPAGLPMSLPPVFSCRSGLPVLLNAVTKQGPPAPKPFKLHITRKETDLTEMNVIQFQELPMDQALSERRLKLVLDSSGRCTHVLSGDESVFGFSPDDLVGASLGDFIDAFQSLYTRQPIDKSNSGKQFTPFRPKPSGSMLSRVSHAVKTPSPPQQQRQQQQQGPLSPFGSAPGQQQQPSRAATATALIGNDTLEQMDIEHLSPSPPAAPQPPSATSAPMLEDTEPDEGGADSAAPGDESESPDAAKPSPFAPKKGALHTQPQPPSAPMPPSPSPIPLDTVFSADPQDLDNLLNDGMAATPSQLMEKVLLVLAAKAHRAPRTSYRVGVVHPEDGQAAAAGGAQALGGLGALLGHGAPRPAVMTVSVSAGSALAKENSGRAGRRLVDTLSKKAMDSAHAAAHGANGGSGNEEEEAVREVLTQTGGNLAFVVELWRADLMSGIIELDPSGTIAHSTALPLHPPGLIFGLPEHHMLGHHISKLLPVPPNTTAASFFEPLGGDTVLQHQNTAELQARKRTTLKAPERSGKRLPGPVQLIMTMHQTDQEGLEVAVQAVHKLGPGAPGGAYLVVRPLQPACSRPDLPQFLIRAQHEEASQAAAAQQEARMRRQRGLSGPLASASPDSPLVSMSSFVQPSGPSGGRKAPSRKASRQALMNGGASGTPALMSQMSNTHGFLQASSGPLFVPQPPVAARAINGIATLGRPVDQAQEQRLVHFNGAGGSPGASPVNNNAQTGQERIAQWISSLSGTEALGGATGSGGANNMDLSPFIPPRESIQDPLSTIATQKIQTTGMQALKVVDVDDMEDPEQQKEVALSGDSSRRLSVAEAGLEEGDHTATSDSEMLEPGLSAEEAGYSIQETDYKRGQRFKKLQRILLSPLAQRRVERFQKHAYAVILLTLAVNLGLFILQIMLINQQRTGVNNLYSVGIAARLGIRIANLMRPMDLLYSGKGLKTLTGLTNVSSDMPTLKDRLLDYTTKLEYLHNGVYLGFQGHRTLPDDYGLRTLWEVPTLTERVYEDTTPVITYTRLASLYDVGNRFIARAENIWQLSDLVASINSTGGIWEWGEVQYVVNNGPSVMTPAYYTTMDDFLSIAVDSAHSINNIQAIVLIMEGIFVGVISLGYMWLLSSQVMWQRYTMFNVFIVIPVGIARALGTTPITLGDDDEEDENDLAEAVGVNRGDGKADGKETVIKLHLDTNVLAGTLVNTGNWFDYTWRRMGRALGFPMTPTNVKSSKRRLTTSFSFIAWLTWPFLLWAVINVTLNVLAYESLQTADSPIATFNLVNAVAARFQRVLFYAQELCITTDPKYKESVRSTLIARYATFKSDWDAAMYGGSVVNSTLARYTLAKTGMVQAGGEGDEILFKYQGCMRFNQSGCMHSGDVFYQWTNNGLDRLMHFYMDLIEQMVNATAGPYPQMTGWEFQFLWTARDDMQDGLQRATDAFYNMVHDVYDFSYQLLIAKFALSVVISLCIFLFLLRPFLAGLRNEARRVAELLCQLPSDIAVEDMVCRAMGLSKSSTTAMTTTTLVAPSGDSISAVGSKASALNQATTFNQSAFGGMSAAGYSMGKDVSSYKF